jgi:transglycosylase-like protein with SLT domain
MRAIFRRSIVHDVFRRFGALPCRLNLTSALFSSSRQQHCHARTFAASIVCIGSLRAIAGTIATVTALASSIVALPVIASGAYAQNVTRAEPTDRFAGFIAEASARFVVPARWISAVMQVESGGDEHATSPRGAMGLMQLMPGTWVELSARHRLGLDPFDPHDNILAGAAYLKEMYDRFGSEGFLAAYHAGPLRYQQHLTTGRPLPQETLAYIVVLAPMLTSEQRGHDVPRVGSIIPWRQSPLFIERRDAALTEDRSAPEVQRAFKPTALIPGSSKLSPPPADLFVRPLREGQSQ